MTNIQWFPGHMAKALRQIEENISHVDIIFELVDARIPMTSQNPEIKRIINNKAHLLILTKSDLANPSQTSNWIRFFKHKGLTAIAVNSKANITTKMITKITQSLLTDKLTSEQTKGLRERPIRAITVGIPNVGKSTLLNKLVNKKGAKIGDMPGVTKGTQWLRSSSRLFLLDTPGILWPKFKNEVMGYKLALTGAIKENLFANDDVALFAIQFFRNCSEQAIFNRYKLSSENLFLNDVDLLLAITKKMGLRNDYEQASKRLILDIRHGKLGRYTLDFRENNYNEEQICTKLEK